MKTITYDTSVTIAAPREAVWTVLSEVAAWPEWHPAVTKVQALDGNSLSLGSRFVVHQPKLRAVTWVVSKLEKPRLFDWDARSPGLALVAEHTVHEESPRKSILNLRFSFHGIIGWITSKFYGSITKKYLVQEAAAIKQKVEASR